MSQLQSDLLEKVKARNAKALAQIDDREQAVATRVLFRKEFVAT